MFKSMDKNKTLFIRLLLPVILLISSIIWNYFTGEVTFEVIQDSLGVIAIYYFIISLFEYFSY